jgi:hypothetical protein
MRFESGRSQLSVEDELAAERELDRLRGIAFSSTDRAALFQVEAALQAFESQQQLRAVQQARAAELAALTDAQQRLRAELSSFDTELNVLRSEGNVAAAARTAALASVNACRALLDSTDLASRQTAHAAARAALLHYQAELQTAQQLRTEQQTQAAEVLALGEEELAGLRADATAQRWAASQIEELATRLASWRSALAKGDSAQVTSAALAGFRQDSAALLERVNAAQFKADQRDYIARSIGDTLSEMGFLVTELQPEHADHPASAVRFQAVNAVGQGIGISVPVEGEVWYDISGFPLSTETTVGGGSAAVCDSAQAVLEEMHDVLNESFGVRAGELQWEGKDPDRHLRAVQQLPRTTGIDSGQERDIR